MVKFLVKNKEALMARRERNVFKRKDGRYEARYIKYRDENGKAKYGSVYAPTYAIVKTKLDKAKAEIHQCPHVPESPRRTIANAIEMYLSNIKHQVKEFTHGLYTRYFEDYGIASF